MYKILYVFMILPVLFCSQIILIENLFCGTYTITIYKDSRIIILSQPENTEISYYLKDIFKGAKYYPSYLVYRNEDVQNSIQNGFWLKVSYKETLSYNDMTFDELLFRVDKNIDKINIIRGNRGIFRGRGYFLELNQNIDSLYDYIDTISLNSLKRTEIELETQENESISIKRDESENENEGKNKTNRE